MGHTTVWLDHEKAYIFQYDAQGIKEKIVEGTRHADAEHIKKFYHEVAVFIGSPAQLLIVGPGTAKDEFRRHCEDHHHTALAKAIVGIETMKHHPLKSEVLDVSRKFFNQHFSFHSVTG